MTVAATTRKAGPYTGNGTTTEFAFTFKVFEASDLVVARTSDDGEVTLALNTDYSVSLNSDQDNNPGGKVTLKAALEDGALLAIVSAVSYDQLAIFTNKGGFYPETLNECYDKLTILVQQLLEELSRTIKVDVTDTMSSSELKQKLLDAAESATVVAKGYAESAKQSADSAAASEEKTAEYAEAATIVAPIATEVKAVAGAIDAITTVSENVEAVKVVAENAKTIVPIAGDIKTVAENVDAVKTVSSIAEDVSSVAENAKEIAAVGKNIDDVHNAAQLLPHTDDIGAIKGHLDEVHKVGQDLLGVNSADFDCGEIGDELDSITTVVDGYIKKVAEHIDDCIHPVGEDLEAIEIVASNLDPVNQVAEVMTTDYEKIFNEGVS